jgi:putative endonuclease
VVLIVTEALGYGRLMQNGTEKRELGKQGEELAERFLRARHYVVVERNYRCSYGEIDLVMQDGETLVFVEVRSHTGSTFGDPLESITLRKQRQIAKAASHYVLRHKIENRPLRFDVIGVQWDNGASRVTHVPGAFDWPVRR